MKKRLVSIGLLLTMAMTFVSCGTSEDKNKSDRLRVSATIYPLQEFAQKIGGDKVEVTSIIPNGVEPHDFDPKPKDFETLLNSDVFVYNGLGMEEWLDSIMSQVEDKGIEIIDSSKGANIMPIDDNHEDDHEHSEAETEEHSADDGHNHGAYDPHIWLSLKEATVQAENIKNALVKVDPDNKSYYEENYNNLKAEFDNLYNEYKPKFEALENDDFVTSHAAFGYLCRDFDLDQHSLSGYFGAEGEALPQNKQKLIQYCKDNNVKTIFSETASSQKESESLAKESGAKVEKIYSLETKEDDKSYIDAMKENLEKVYSSLK